jgi:hypothetical protein
MALIKSTATRNADCNLMVDRIDLGSATPYGRLATYTSDGTTLSLQRLSNPAFTDAADGTAYIGVTYGKVIYDSTAFVDGTIASFGFLNRDATFVWGGSVTLPGVGGDMELSSLSVTANDTTVSISSGYYVVP